jgi:hypothetical protein
MAASLGLLHFRPAFLFISRIAARRLRLHETDCPTKEIPIKGALNRLAIYLIILVVLVPTCTSVPMHSTFSEILAHYYLRSAIPMLIIIILFEGIYRLYIYARRRRNMENQPTNNLDA